MRRLASPYAETGVARAVQGDYWTLEVKDNNCIDFKLCMWKLDIVAIGN